MLELATNSPLSYRERLLVPDFRLDVSLRWIDMVEMFGRAPSTLYHIFYFVVKHLNKTFADLLYFDAERVTKNFIDETVRPICRPRIGQQTVYNGHKRNYAFKFQTVVASDGDPAYGCTNVAMTKVRVSVEWSYGEITRCFSYLDFKRQQRATTTSVATLYKIGALFSNCITIVGFKIHQLQILQRPPPTFDEYFASTP
ncbi:hypothetical protein PHMEG_00012978 [Phytophthora megakarya]|uniref:DDE Tnp4 domain-containing protein n=1 Tax=Phytophthora megakarya TaxID=4795 RepID=A0A225W8Y6_9STRA|nr:hypothetical protein PHMEG_00012978 [Phytophthora megakarya]